MRLFLAISLPDDLRAVVLRLQASLREDPGPAGSPAASWVRPEAMQVTLRFLGEVEPERVPALTAALGPALGDLPPVQVAVAGGGAFPEARRPRVLWVGLADGGGLTGVAARGGGGRPGPPPRGAGSRASGGA